VKGTKIADNRLTALSHRLIPTASPSPPP
jgi:hypothetical protein